MGPCENFEMLAPSDPTWRQRPLKFIIKDSTFWSPTASIQIIFIRRIDIRASFPLLRAPTESTSSTFFPKTNFALWPPGPYRETFEIPEESAAHHFPAQKHSEIVVWMFLERNGTLQKKTNVGPERPLMTPKTTKIQYQRIDFFIIDCIKPNHFNVYNCYTSLIFIVFLHWLSQQALFFFFFSENQLCVVTSSSL